MRAAKEKRRCPGLRSGEDGFESEGAVEAEPDDPVGIGDDGRSRVLGVAADLVEERHPGSA